jgi:hypothetical protein
MNVRIPANQAVSATQALQRTINAHKLASLIELSLGLSQIAIALGGDRSTPEARSAAHKIKVILKQVGLHQDTLDGGLVA